VEWEGRGGSSIAAVSRTELLLAREQKEQFRCVQFTAHMTSRPGMIRPTYYNHLTRTESNPTHCDATIVDPDPMSLVAYDASSDEEDAGEPPAAAAPPPPPSAGSPPRPPQPTPPPPAPSQ
jgi:hypothetical protein